MLLASVALAAAGVVAQPTPLPAPTTPASDTTVRQISDPCGGSQELLKKYLANSPCVFVLGQGSVQITYGSTNIPANVVVTGGAQNTANGFRHAVSYPSTIMNVGITRNSQIRILLPSFSKVSSSLIGTVVAGTADINFGYKNLAYVNRVKGILGGFSLAYEAPTGSPGLAAPGPIYQASVLANFALNNQRSIALNVTLPVINATSGEKRSWSFSPQAVTLWRSPGGTLLAFIVQHDFSSNATTVTINMAQLIARQFQVQATYGGSTTSIDYANPVEEIVRATGTAHPRSLIVGFSYMIGRSELPPR